MCRGDTLEEVKNAIGSISFFMCYVKSQQNCAYRDADEDMSVSYLIRNPNSITRSFAQCQRQGVKPVKVGHERSLFCSTSL